MYCAHIFNTMLWPIRRRMRSTGAFWSTSCCRKRHTTSSSRLWRGCVAWPWRVARSGEAWRVALKRIVGHRNTYISTDSTWEAVCVCLHYWDQCEGGCCNSKTPRKGGGGGSAVCGVEDLTMFVYIRFVCIRLWPQIELKHEELLKRPVLLPVHSRAFSHYITDVGCMQQQQHR